MNIDKEFLNIRSKHPKEWIDLIWEVCHLYRQITEDASSYSEEEWNEITTAMAWIEESLKEAS
jgi:hypothetical protein